MKIKLGCIGLFIMIFCFNCAKAQQKDNTNKRVYEVWDDAPAPNRGGNYAVLKAKGYPYDKDWEWHSYPIGNGYMGANIFGRTDTERIQITEKTLANEGLYNKGGLTNFAEIFLDINHYNPKNYKRSINLNDGVLYVDYEHDGVKYSREYLANYPENIIAIKLSANKKGKISFTLKPEIPYKRSVNEINTKLGKSIADKDLITLSGQIKHFSVNYECQIKILNEGGTLHESNTTNPAQIRVENANSVVLLIAAGTNYKLSSDVFLESTKNKKLNIKELPHEKVSNRISNAVSKGYEELKRSHFIDYKNIFSRVNIEIASKVSTLPTKTLLKAYKANPKENLYLEELIFNYGRYLLISSSRKGTLPSGLQGVWSQYLVTPWTGGYWHNINVQMNYWSAFSTNMAETFLPYIEYYNAYLPQCEKIAYDYIKKNNPNSLAKDKSENGWAIGTGATAYVIGKPGGHSGPGTAGFTTKLFWDYFEFTKDTTFLKETGYPALLGASKFLSKTLIPQDDGVLLAAPSASPEIRIKNEKGRYGGEHYITKGTTFDQGFIWETFNDLLKAAKILGKNDAFLKTVQHQITKLDPVLIGGSGQLKEYREEDKYGEIGDPHHRHVSHLCTLYPGTLINSNKPEWMKAAVTALDLRGNFAGGWALAHRMNLRARAKQGDEAHKAFSKVLQKLTLPNLWTTYPPFQIDANFGVVAGISEMLIQSHEGYIDLLPAVPEVWKTGACNGLVARGNFEISMAWKNKRLQTIKIASRSGGVCALKFGETKNVKITDKNGREVPFIKTKWGGVEFNSIKNKNYYIKF